MFPSYFKYAYEEMQKKKFVQFAGYTVLKSILKIDDGDKMFKQLEKVLGFECFMKEKEPETIENIKNKVLRRK